MIDSHFPKPVLARVIHHAVQLFVLTLIATVRPDMAGPHDITIHKVPCKDFIGKASVLLLHKAAILSPQCAYDSHMVGINVNLCVGKACVLKGKDHGVPLGLG